MDLLHRASIEATLTELRTAAQQAQLTLAAANETLQSVNTLVLRVTAIVDAVAAAKRST
jgi:hypothetical protein